MKPRAEDALDFWSRRRAAVAAEERAAEARKAAEAEAAELAAREGQSDEEILADLGLPDPDTLGLGDDFKGFLARGVPAHLRQRALRRLWLSNPVLANLDGLVDHAEDFTDAATVMPDMKTAYRVGRGILRQLAEVADEVEAANVAAAPEVAPEDAPEGGAAEAAIEAAPTATAPAIKDADPADEPAAPPRRHMRFAFAG